MANENTNLAQKVLEIGDRLKEGNLTTVVFDFDENKNPVRVLEDIFIAEARFSGQDKAVAEANARLSLQGQKALTRLSDNECARLAEVWDKVAPSALQGSAAPWFWGASTYNGTNGCVYRGGGADHHNFSRRYWYPVPASLRGPVQS